MAIQINSIAMPIEMTQSGKWTPPVRAIVAENARNVTVQAGYYNGTWEWGLLHMTHYQWIAQTLLNGETQGNFTLLTILWDAFGVEQNWNEAIVRLVPGSSVSGVHFENVKLEFRLLP